MSQFPSEASSVNSVAATPLQQGMIFHNMSEPGSGIDIEQIEVRSSTRLEHNRLDDAFNALIREHEVLRSFFEFESSDQPQLRVAFDLSITIGEETAGSEPELDELLTAYLKAERKQGFRLDVAPLMRATVFHLGNSSVLVWTFHHALLDGRSFAPLLEELFLRYLNKDPVTTDRPRFLEYAKWLEAYDHRSDLEYWKNYLAGLRAPGIFPTLTTKKDIDTFGFQEKRLDKSETLILSKQCTEIGISVNILLQAAWGLLLHHYTDLKEVVFGATYTTRYCGFPASEDMIGLMINTLPVRVDLASSQTGIDLLRQLSKHAEQVRPHVLAPLNLVKQQVDLPNGAQLFDTAVVFDHLDLDAALRLRQPDWNDLQCTYTGQTNFSLALIAYGGDSLSLRLEYDHRRIDDDHGGAIFTAYCNLLRELSTNLDAVASKISMLSPGERQRKLTPQNTSIGEGECLHETFRKIAAQYSNRVALRCGDQSLTYQELDRRSDLIASALFDAGVKLEDKVGICMERSNDLIVGILGVLKSGCAYVPIDPEYPDARILFTLDDAGIEHIVSDLATRDRLLGFGRSLIIESSLETGSKSSESSYQDIKVSDKNLAYVIYTSGSTGMPKGVAITHRNVSRLMGSTQQWFNFGPEDKWTLFHSIAFDWTVFEIWGALTYGGELNVVPYWVTRSPEDFYRLLSENEITVLCQTPSAFLNLQNADDELHELYPHHLKFVIFGGEALELRSLTRWVNRHGDARPRLVNMYGITETTVHVTYRRITREDVEAGQGSVIGEPIPDLDILLLNCHAEPVAAGVVAEIYVAGEGLARGYLNQPELTREKFCEDLSSDLEGVRLYRSGDLARWLPNGDLIYCGRADFQVKIRGFRIELGEIENSILSIPGVQQAVVVAIKGPADTSRLIAYYVAKEISPAEISEAVTGLLPVHMIPGQIIQLTSFPLTQNGKVDRQQLPDPDFSTASAQYRAADSDTERQLVKIFEEILKLENIGIDDNFFELGGDSILSIQLISKARKYGIRLAARDIYQNPTISAMAQLTNGHQFEDRLEDDVAVDGDVPLLPVQRWFFDAVGYRDHWNQSFSFLVRRAIPASELRKALEEIARRHPILSARYEKLEAGWSQRLVDIPKVWVQETDTEVGYEDSLEQREGFALQVNKQVNPGAAKNICAGLLNFGDGTQELYIAIHHLVVDGITWNVIIHELDEVLDASRDDSNGFTAISSPETVFVEWSRYLSNNAAQFDNEKTYWEERDCLNEVDPQTSAGFRHGAYFQLSRGLDPDAWPTRSGVTRQEIVLSAFVGALSSVFTRSRIQIDVESHGRSHEVSKLDFSNAAGWYTSIYPFSVSIPEENEPLALLEAVHREVIAVPNNGIGYGVLRSRGELRHQGFAEHLFNYMGNFSGLFGSCRQLQFIDPFYQTWRCESASHSHPCEWIVAIEDSRICIDVMYDETCFSSETIGIITEAFLQRIEATIALIREQQIIPDKLLVTTSAWEQAKTAARTATRILPTSPIQDLYLFGNRGGVDIGIEQWYLKLEGSLDTGALRRAWEETLQNHTGLCTTFPFNSRGKNLQAFHPEANIEWQDRAIDQTKDLADIRREDLSNGLNLVSGPLHRFSLLDAGDQVHYLVWTHHHVHIDGWSWPIVLREAHGRYRRIVDGHRDLDRSPSSDYASYVEWISRSRPKIDLHFWKKYLAELGSEGRLPHEQTGENGTSTITDVLDSKFTDQIRSAALKEGVTISSMYHSAWAYALAMLLSKQRVCIGSTFSGRPAGDVDFTSVVGPFVTNLPLRVTFDNLGPIEVLRSVHEDLLGHQERQFYSPAEIQGASNLPWMSPMFESLMVYQNYQIDDSTFDLGSAVKITETFTPVRTNFPLTIVVVPDKEARLDFIYDRARLSAKFVESAALLVRNFLTAVVDRRTPDIATDYNYADFLIAEQQVSPRGQAPGNEQEEKLVEIWRGLFGDERIGVTDNFFDLGGRSIMVPILMSRIETETGATVPFAILFQDPTVKGLARYLRGISETPSDLVARGRLRADRSKAALRMARRKRVPGGAPNE